MLVVSGRHLVDQASRRLLHEGIDHGVIMNGHARVDPHNTIQICSMDTLRSRGLFPPADIIVIDEAHNATSKSYLDFLAQYPNVYILGVTATPYAKKGLGHIAEVVVKPITFDGLVEQGFLVPPKYFAPSLPEMEGVRVSKQTGDFNLDDIEAVMGTATLFGSIVGNWQRLARGLPTVCFAVSIRSSKIIVEQFNRVGIPAAHIEAGSSDEERKEVLLALEQGRIKVVSNVGILCVGVDLPFVSCIISARPTQSFSLFCQQCGRGSRPFPGKSNFILLDHAGNLFRHGFVNQEKEANLSPCSKPEPKIDLKRCATCFHVFQGTACTLCGEVPKNITKPKQYKIVEGRLEAITEEDAITMMILGDIKKLKEAAKSRGFRRGWVYYQLVQKYGDKVADKFMPKREVPEWVLKKKGI